MPAKPGQLEPIGVSVPKASELSSICETLIWAKIKSGELDSALVGGRRVVLYESLKKLLTPDTSRRHSPSYRPDVVELSKVVRQQRRLAKSETANQDKTDAKTA